MSRRKNLLSGAICIVVLAAIVGYIGWSELQKQAALACAASIHQGILSLSNSELGLTPDIGSTWKVLSNSESDRLILATSQVHPLDCRNRELNGLPLDPWSNRFRIAARWSTANNKLEFMVWSEGKDKVPGTSDDTVSPYGEKVPSLSR